MVEIGDLKKFEVFGTFSEEHLKALAKISKKKSYKIHEHVHERGQRAKHLFVVERGLVSLREIDPEDQAGIAFEMRERGELFGVACFVKPQNYTLTAVCLEDSEILALDADGIFDLCEGEPELGYRLMTKIAQLYFERYRVAKRQIHEMVKAAPIITALPG